MEEVELHSPFPTLSLDHGLAPSTAQQKAGWKIGQEGPIFTKTIPTHWPPHPSRGVGRSDFASSF